MPAPVPMLGYRSKSAAAFALREAGQSIDEIATAIGLTPRQARRLLRYDPCSVRVEAAAEPTGPVTYAQPRPSSLLDEILLVAAAAQLRREEKRMGRLTDA